MTRPDHTLAATDDARILARTLLRAATHAALAVTDADTGTPGISRIAWGLGPEGGGVTLISALAQHFAALKAQPACAVMVGEAGHKGDPLTHPRLMLRATAVFVAPDDPTRPELGALWLAARARSEASADSKAGLPDALVRNVARGRVLADDLLAAGPPDLARLCPAVTL